MQIVVLVALVSDTIVVLVIESVMSPSRPPASLPCAKPYRSLGLNLEHLTYRLSTFL